MEERDQLSSDDPLDELIEGVFPRKGGAGSVFRRAVREPLAPMPGLDAGKVVGDFELVALIGRGGMGQVWEARQHSLGNRRVAVKFVLPEHASERGLALFAREARAGGRLSHPGIVAVHGHGEVDGLSWIAMQFVEGSWTLRDFIDLAARGNELAPDHDRRVTQLVAQLADALEAAHRAGVTHRDVKPQNVLIDPDDQPKLTDFGLARVEGESGLGLTSAGAGTCSYMSPEQIAGRRGEIDHRTDVFSLGVVLYELLTLQRPFRGDTEQQVISRILGEDPPDPRVLRASVPRELAAIAGKALEKARERRYQTMGELAADLRRFLAGEPVRARPPSGVDRLGRWIRRNPAKSATSGVAGIALIAVTTLYVRARSEAAKVLRLSDVKVLEELELEADALWPPYPEKIGALESWSVRARQLVGRLPIHRGALSEMRRRGRPSGDDEPVGDADERRAWIFDSPEDQWQHDVLTELIANLEGLHAGLLAEDSIEADYGWSVPRRIAFAKGLAAGFAPGGTYAALWERDLPPILATYPGLDLKPQIGLVPVGPDPESGLWEFAHLMTGEPAERDADGKLVLREETGVVLVLLPHGTFWMGAQSGDPQGRNYDPEAEEDEGPVHEVELSAYFLSKYEMTQGQWERLTGRNPSHYQDSELAPTLLHPVEQITWPECTSWLARAGLALPSEAQWENGVRGGTETPWWTGEERESLREKHAANLADQAARQSGAPWAAIQDWPELNDGFVAHAPVGTYAANALGLHEVVGNLEEWCSDAYESPYADAGHLERDPIVTRIRANTHVYRGGSFANRAVYARSTQRNAGSLQTAFTDLGVRPARLIGQGP